MGFLGRVAGQLILPPVRGGTTNERDTLFIAPPVHSGDADFPPTIPIPVPPWHHKQLVLH
jgi:hypothetical protein